MWIDQIPLDLELASDLLAITYSNMFLKLPITIKKNYL